MSDNTGYSNTISGQLGFWTTYSTVITAAGTTATLMFDGLGAGTACPSCGNEITNVSFSAVPEPSIGDDGARLRLARFRRIPSGPQDVRRDRVTSRRSIELGRPSSGGLSFWLWAVPAWAAPSGRPILRATTTVFAEAVVTRKNPAFVRGRHTVSGGIGSHSLGDFPLDVVSASTVSAADAPEATAAMAYFRSSGRHRPARSWNRRNASAG